ncbi:MAG: hypothetical protein ACOYKZ_07470 [Chlamydiia bacterium]
MSSIFGAAIGVTGVYLAHTALIAGGAALPATLPVVAMALGAAALIGLFTGRNAGKDGSTMPQATLLAMIGGLGAQWWANGQPASRSSDGAWMFVHSSANGHRRLGCLRPGFCLPVWLVRIKNVPIASTQPRRLYDSVQAPPSAFRQPRSVLSSQLLLQRHHHKS